MGRPSRECSGGDGNILCLDGVWVTQVVSTFQTSQNTDLRLVFHCLKILHKELNKYETINNRHTNIFRTTCTEACDLL